MQRRVVYSIQDKSSIEMNMKIKKTRISQEQQTKQP